MGDISAKRPSCKVRLPGSYGHHLAGIMYCTVVLLDRMNREERRLDSPYLPPFFRPFHFIPTMASSATAAAKDKVPILLLKTKSTPGDGYEDILSQPQHGLSFDPSFVPVLEHRFEEDGMKKLEFILNSKMTGSHFGASYGGLIFTSQRAVEALTKIVQDGQGEKTLGWLTFFVSFLTPNGSQQQELAIPAKCACV